MKRLVKYICFIVMFFAQLQAASAFLPNLGHSFFISKPEAKQQERDAVVKQLEDFKIKIKRERERKDDQSTDIKQDIAQTKQLLATEPENEFLAKKLVLLNDRYQAFIDLAHIIEHFIASMSEYAQLLDEYLKDPDLKQYYNELGTANRVSFSFEDLRQLKEKIESKKASIELLQQQETHTLIEIKSREQAAMALGQQYKQKKDERESTEDQLPRAFDLSEKQKRELLNLEFVLLGTKRVIDDFQLQILEFRLKKIRAKIEMEKMQLQVLQEVFTHIKQSSIRISEADLAFARDELEKKRQEINAEKLEVYEPKKDALKERIDSNTQALQELSAQHNIPVSDELREWTFASKTSPELYESFFVIAQMQLALTVERLELEELESHIALQDQSLLLERIANDIKTSFYKIYAGKFASEEKIFDEIKRYEARLSDIKADLSQLENKKTIIEAQVAVAKKALENIMHKEQDLLQQKERLFKQNSSVYGRIHQLLKSSEDLVQQQIKTLNTIRGTYNDTVAKLIKTEQQVHFTIEELRASSRNIIWDRPEDAISWQGIMAMVPNIETFFHDVKLYIMHFDVRSLVYKIKSLFYRGYTLFYFIVWSIAWVIFLVISWILLGYGKRRLSHTCGKRAVYLFVYVTISFIRSYFWIIAAWLSGLIIINCCIIPDPYPYIIFYLVSIPLLLYGAYVYLRDIMRANIEHNYLLVNVDYQRRFFICVATFVYVTITILLFRQAFILGNYPKSELPNILKALNIIILQLASIFLLTKDLVLGLIPRGHDIWLMIREKVDHYYYVMLFALIAVVIMMNPYVGFGRLVLFVLSRVIYTFVVVGVLIWLHNLVKSGSSALFFQTDSEGSVKERFAVAKTWYGVSIICILCTFICVGAVIIAKIWQWPEPLNNIKEIYDIIEWLKTPILLQDTQSPISVYTMLQFIMFVLGGFLVANGLRKFVLSRIFDILLVDSGVQNTINSLTRYIIYLIATMLGLNAAGLGAQINYMITALLVGIGIIIKDPAADFFAYFIILVQRPIKIGDYIKVDDEVMGVVRKITPRSIVLRRKNSTMIIVPNSYVVNHTIVNWNYLRGFIAFEDIHVMVTYKSDPAQVKEVLERILDTSPYVLKNPKPVVRLHEFGPNGYEFLLRGFISSNYTLDQWDIASDIRLQIVKTFRQQGIEFGLPIRLMMQYSPSHNAMIPDMSVDAHMSKE